MLLQTPCFSPPHTGHPWRQQPEHRHLQGPGGPCDIHSRCLISLWSLLPSQDGAARTTCVWDRSIKTEAWNQKAACVFVFRSWRETLRVWHGRRVIPACHLALAARWSYSPRRELQPAPELSHLSPARAARTLPLPAGARGARAAFRPRATYSLSVCLSPRPLGESSRILCVRGDGCLSFPSFYLKTEQVPGRDVAPAHRGRLAP